MKHKIIFLFAVALSLCAITKVNAQLTRQQAIQKVLNEIVVADTGKIDVYSVIPLKYYQDTVALPDDSTLLCPYNYNWVFFINDHPNAAWAHDCRYIFIDTISGNYQIKNENFYPLAFTTPDSVDFDLVKEIYHYPAANIPPTQNTQTRTTTTNDHLYAVIIVTEDAVMNPHQDYHNFFWNDASAMFCTLVNVYGYSKDHIYVHYYNGTSPISEGDLDKDENQDNDIDYPASKSRILETFDNLAGTSNSDPNIPALTPSDQLFVFMDGHGIKMYDHSTLACAYPGPTYDYLYDNELAQHIEGINCAQMIFLIQPCFSGNFATELTNYTNYNVSCKNRSVHTSTSADLYSTTEFYMTNNSYMEYTFYWTAAARCYYPEFNHPWSPSYAVGSFPFDQYYPFNDHPDDYNPDLNNDGFIQMEEAFSYADDMDAWSPNGYHHPDIQCWECYEEPVNKDKIGYDNGTKYNNLITLFGMAGSVLDDDILFSNRNYMSGNTITVTENNTFTIDDNSLFYLTGADTKITVNKDGELDINDNVNTYNNQIDINGDLTIGQNVTFNDMDINLLNNNMSTTFDKTTFNSSQLTNYGQSLTISNSFFTSSVSLFANSYNGNISVSNTSFNNTWLYIKNQSSTPGLTANVSNCTFQTGYAMAAIDLWGYDKFNIENNTMHGYYNGIQMFSSGNGSSGNQNIFGNEIYNNTMTGILIYNSTVSISSNYIHNNKYGIRLNDNSNIALYGNPAATTYKDVNYITDNVSYEVCASTGSFPWSFHYNAIIDEDNAGNPSDPMVYYQPPSGGYPLIDVKYNCWGNNFNPAQDLYPSGYIVNPTWCPGNGGGGNKSVEIARQIFEAGLTHFDSLEYTVAKTSFDSVINNYPHSQYAEAAMKELFSIEQFVNNDYSTLKQFYQTNDSILADTSLSKLSGFLSNKCEVKLENWQTAIDHYIDIIDNPESTEDSIFAVIDLGYTYLLMNSDSTNSKSVTTGNHQDLFPKSEKEYREKTNYLLSLLPIKNKKGNKALFTFDNIGILSQNHPNPFGNTTEINYKLNSEANIVFEVYNYSGQLLDSWNLGTKKEGIHTFKLDASNMKNGIYFYTIKINGQKRETKKMLIMK